MCDSVYQFSKREVLTIIEFHDLTNIEETLILK